jgi:hypothetical protein
MSYRRRPQLLAPLSCLVVACLAACLAYADINPLVNPGFETGDLTGWTVSSAGPAPFYYNTFQNWDGYAAMAGNYFLVTSAQLPNVPETDVYQDVTLKPGDVLQGWAACTQLAYGSGAAAVYIFHNGALVATPWSATGTGYSQSPWTAWSWTATTAGTYRLDYQVTNASGDTCACFDAPVVVICTISGTVTDHMGTPIPGVTVATTGATTTTASDGTYTLGGLAAGSYPVTASQTGGTFTSVAKQPITVGPDATGINFLASYSVSGTVSDGAGHGLSRVHMKVMMASGGGATFTATTAADGTYAITDLPAGSWQIGCAQAGMNFTPPVRYFTTGAGAPNTGVNFVGAADTYTISGTVIDGFGGCIAGACVSTTGASCATALDGTYTLRGLDAGTYKVTATKSGGCFTSVRPQPITVNQTVGNAYEVDFVRTFSISGTLRDAAGHGLGGVSVSLQTPAGDAGPHLTTTTAANGTYTFSGLLAGTYVITPDSSEWIFTPLYRSVTVNETVGNATGVNFVGR